MRAGGSAPAGSVLLLDKPAGPTSHDVVARVRRVAGTRKVGHAGTLDPMATGLLILGVGTATRLLTYVVGAGKEYEATIRLGSSTVTDDAEGETLEAASAAAVRGIGEAAVLAGIQRLTGEILQVPSRVSAIKIDGKRAYARVREGERVELPARPVTVSEFSLLGPLRAVEDAGHAALDLDVRVQCSSGTYIRSLARDLGERLGVGGHLRTLRRTRVGPFRVEEAVGLATLEDGDEPSRLAAFERARIAPAEAATRLLGAIRLTEEQAVDLGHGKRIRAVEGQLSEARSPATGPLAALAPDGRLVGLVEFQSGQGRTVVNFPADPPAGASGDDPEAGSAP